MEWLNYHHLRYFWVVAKHGTVSGASRELGLTRPTISGQVHRLEEILGEKLLEHRGHRLALTEMGRVAFGYAEEIFGLGKDFRAVLQGAEPSRPIPLVVGLSDVLPKAIAHKMLQPALTLEQPVRVVVHEVRSAALPGEVGLRAVDVVLTDSPAPPGGARVFTHLLGKCGTSFFAVPSLAARLRSGFPDSLEGAPLLLPGDNSVMRRTLEQWLEDLHLWPRIVAEAEDSSLLMVLGEAGLGVVAVPDVVERDVRARHGLSLIGRVPELRQHFYAISIERKIKHPAVVAICEASRNELFR